MKKIIFSLSILLLAFTSYGKSVSESKVPIMVKATFYNTYPMADHVKWGITEKHDYAATFNLNNTNRTIYYNDQGEFVESDMPIEWKDVPFTGRMEIYHSGNEQILNVLKIENQKHEIFYQVDMKDHHKKIEVLLDQEGNIIK